MLKAGCNPDALGGKYLSFAIVFKAYLETHRARAVLDSEDLPLGIVTGIRVIDGPSAKCIGEYSHCEYATEL